TRSLVNVQCRDLRRRSLIEPCRPEQTIPAAPHWWFGKRGFPHKVSLPLDLTFPFWIEKEATRIGLASAKRLRSKDQVRMLLKERLLKFEYKPHSRTHPNAG